MILTITPNPLLDYVLHTPTEPEPGGHRLPLLDFTVGGKGINVARMLKTLGRPGLALSFAGGPNGQKIRSKLRDQGVAAEWIESQAETRAGINLVVETPPKQTWWLEEGEELAESEVQEFLNVFRGHLARAGFVAMSGSIPGHRNQNLFRRILECARGFAGEMYLDARGEALQEALQIGGFFLKHNRQEARETFGIDPIDRSSRATLKERLLERRVWGGMVTDGPNDVWWWEGAEEEVLHPLPIREVSAVGSGDAAMAGLLFARAEKMPFREAVRWAMAAGAADAEFPGPCMAEYSDVLRQRDRIQPGVVPETARS